MKNEEIQKKYLELQNFEEQVKLIQQHVIQLNQQIMELSVLESSLDEIKETKVGSEVLVPLGSSIFTKAKLLNNKEVIMGVGVNINIQKSISEAKKVVRDQITEMQKMMKPAEEQLQHIAIEAQQIQQDLASSIEK